ncbi:MAG TPA: DUF4388 domain-containing protein [Desulfobulbus sp.]|nr:DUF4388 domain-containing protein [Desulfobulbus sp.]
MTASFSASFAITEVRNCPLYRTEDRIVLTDRAVSLPIGKPSCLILVRELTGLLFELLPHAATGFAAQRETVYTCGGCTGLVKFRLTEPDEETAEAGEAPGDVVMSGRLDAISPAELLQVFHMHQKTGNLLLDMEGESARVTFREGALLAARFGELDNQEAIYAILSRRRGHFRFVPGLPDPQVKARELGDFMMILMEGLKRLDEDAG